jgi:arylsulfatase A-like enzyme
VLLIVSDDQRPDTIAALGNPHIETPHLDALVRAGTAFTRAVSPNPICICARAELLSGCTSFTNGVLTSGPINPRLTRFAQAMQAGGYRTCYTGKWHNNGRPQDHGYDETAGLYMGGGGQWMPKDAVDWNGRPVTGYRGWVLQDDQGRKFPEKGVGLTPNISAEFADAAIDYLRRREGIGKPFFLHVCFTAPHDPLLIPPGYAGKYDPGRLPLPRNFLPEHPFDHGNFRGRDELLFAWPRTREETLGELAAYYAVISHLDEQIGRLLKALEETGQAENTLVIFTSDQGLAIGSHGLRGKQNMYEHTLGTPLVMRGPAVPAGKRLAGQVYLRDIYPTVCQLTGVPIPESVEAKSFVPLLTGEEHKIHRETYGYFRDCQRALRSDRWKYIRYPLVDREQLFDLQEDPLEMKDLSTDPVYAGIVRDARERLAAWQRSVGDPILK